MENMSVVMKQVPGVIEWNYEDIKRFLEERLAVYENTIYTDDTIKTAKADIANLRKLSAAIEGRRKEVREEYLAPYKLIETQAKELVALINKPIVAINKQVEDYETRRKEKVWQEIRAYWDSKVTALPEMIRVSAWNHLHNIKWENATVSKKTWKDAIDSGIQRILSEIDVIRSSGGDFQEDMMREYRDRLSLEDAFRKKNDMEANQRRILEIEQRKKEAEERQRREAEEARQEAAAAPTCCQPGKPADVWTGPDQEPEAEKNAQNPVKNAQNQGENAQNPGENAHEQKKMDRPEAIMVTLSITGTMDQITRIMGYINFTGASYTVVQASHAEVQ